MTTKRRKSDMWMMPSVVVSLLSILGIVVGGSMWVQATNDDLDKIKSVTSCVRKLEIDAAETKAEIKALDRKLDAMDERQEKRFDKLSDQQDELQRLMIEVLQKEKED